MQCGIVKCDRGIKLCQQYPGKIKSEVIAFMKYVLEVIIIMGIATFDNRLFNKTKYIRIRAFNKDGEDLTFGEWSKVKKLSK